MIASTTASVSDGVEVTVRTAPELVGEPGFRAELIEELSESIKQHGMIQPILVRPVPEAGNRYEIVAGERRWRAAQKAQLHEVPVTIQYLTDEAVLELGLIENLQREDLSPLEEAEAYQQLMTKFGHTQDRVAQAVGKSRSHVANIVRLLNLPETVKTYIREGKLTAGHARTLVTADDPVAMAKAMVEGGLNVREAEAFTNKKKGKGKAKAAKKDTNTIALEREMMSVLGMPVVINTKGKGGSITVNGMTPEQARKARAYGYVFQAAALYPWRTIEKNIALPLEIMGYSSAEMQKRIAETLELVNLSGFAKKYPWQLSGGMQQRTAICRALVHDPKIVLMDEPTGAMDQAFEARFIDRLQNIVQGKTLVIVTHRRAMLAVCDRLIVMDQGLILADGPKNEVIDALKRGEIRRQRPSMQTGQLGNLT
mgnify:CR=1 FL=1